MQQVVLRDCSGSTPSSRATGKKKQVEPALGRVGSGGVRERGLGHVCCGPLISPAPSLGLFFWDPLDTGSSLVTRKPGAAGEGREMTQSVSRRLRLQGLAAGQYCRRTRATGQVPGTGTQHPTRELGT